ncbi:MAG: class I SAM-dependent methyltransferase [Solirubrobacteraceae bacterium]
MSESPLTPIARHNRDAWDAQSDEYQSRHGPQLEASGGDAWGVWQQSESELNVLGDVEGKDVLELGCGAAQWSIALHRRGARTTGLDISERQLAHARRLMEAASVEFPLVHASAEAIPLADSSFDIVFSDFGAMSFAEPRLAIPEVARVLRPGGLLAFLTSTPLLDLAWPLEDEEPGDRLVFDYWDLHEIRPPGEPVVFQLRYGEWIELFVRSGFVVESLMEMRPAADARSTYRSQSAREWARRWPMEHIWRVRKR